MSINTTVKGTEGRREKNYQPPQNAECQNISFHHFWNVLSHFINYKANLTLLKMAIAIVKIASKLLQGSLLFEMETL